MRSNRCALRRMMSTCPLVNGSKEPGKMARRPVGWPAGLIVCLRQVHVGLPAGVLAHAARDQQRQRTVTRRARRARDAATPAPSGSRPRGPLQHDHALGRAGIRRRLPSAPPSSRPRVRRIEQDQIEARGRARAPQHRGGVAALDSIARRHTPGRRVLGRSAPARAVGVHRHDVRGTAAQRLEPHRAGAGKAVEHARAVARAAPAR